MKRVLAVLWLIVLAGCFTAPVPPYKTKYERTGRGHLCDLYVRLDDEWVKFYEDIGGSYNLIQSPNGMYLVVTHPRGSLVTTIKVFLVESRELLDITNWIHGRLPSLASDSVYFTAHRFLNERDVELTLKVSHRWAEEKPIVKALENTRVIINLDEAVEETRYR